MTRDRNTPLRPGAAPGEGADSGSSRAEIAAFLDAAVRTAPPAAGRRGRLVFALDATMSRQPTWDQACALQAEMFRETARAGGLEVQLVYFRGAGECRASRWVVDADALAGLMGRIDCRGGATQIGRVLSHAIAEVRRGPVGALVFVGDAVEEDADMLAVKAGELGILGVPAFVFQEGSHPVAGPVFREIARLSGGAHVRFDGGAASQLGALLRAVAAFASGGRAALTALQGRGDTGARLLLEKLGGR